MTTLWKAPGNNRPGGAKCVFESGVRTTVAGEDGESRPSHLHVDTTSERPRHARSSRDVPGKADDPGAAWKEVVSDSS